MLRGNRDGLRKLPGTVIKNQATGEIVHRPPQNPVEVSALMDNLEQYINGIIAHDVHPLVKMAIIHYQFEAIHPFHDGNGRTGRIMNILYLMREGLLDLPILFMSGQINRSRPEYYAKLSAVDREGAWEDWILYMLWVAQTTATHAVALIKEIRQVMQMFKKAIREHRAADYSQDLVNHLFLWPYITQTELAEAMRINRRTAAKRLETVRALGLLNVKKMGRKKYYVNEKLLALLEQAI